MPRVMQECPWTLVLSLRSTEKGLLRERAGRSSGWGLGNTPREPCSCRKTLGLGQRPWRLRRSLPCRPGLPQLAKTRELGR